MERAPDQNEHTKDENALQICMIKQHLKEAHRSDSIELTEDDRVKVWVGRHSENYREGWLNTEDGKKFVEAFAECGDDQTCREKVSVEALVSLLEYEERNSNTNQTLH